MSKNLGKSTERWVEIMLNQYRAAGIANIKKVDPPTKTVFAKGKPRTILLPNPFLDFHGVWTARGGRAVCFEVKRTDKDSLDIDRDKGLTPSQWRHLNEWEASGCFSFVLWEHGDRFSVLTTAIIKAILLETGRVSVPWSHAIRVPRNNDFLQIVESLTS